MWNVSHLLIKPRNKSCENIRDKSNSSSRRSENKIKKKSKASNIYITNINQSQMNKNNSMCSLPSIWLSINSHNILYF